MKRTGPVPKVPRDSFSNKNPRVLSLFCGCGGLDLGFAQEDYEIVYANDVDEEAIAIFRKNRKLLGAADSAIHLEDVLNVLESGHKFPKAEVVTGGFPCQGFSLAGRRRLDDSRNSLYRAMKKVISQVNPVVFLAENVRGLQNIAHGEVLEQIVNEFQGLGYFVETHLLDAADFGVPQHRERLVIVGCKNRKPFLRIEKTHQDQNSGHSHGLQLNLDYDRSGPSPEDKPLLPHITVRESIGDLEAIPLGKFLDHTNGVSYPKWYAEVARHVGEGQRMYNFRHDKRTVVHTWEIPGEHYGKTLTREETRVLEVLSRNRRKKVFHVPGYIDGSPMAATDLSPLLEENPEKVSELLLRLVEKGHLREREPGKFDFRHGTYNQYQRLSWDQLSRTLVTNVGNPRNMLHPSQHRAPSVRECARLMSFPDDFLFGEDVSPEAKYRMLGNAVPPRLARAIARAIRPLVAPS